MKTFAAGCAARIPINGLYLNVRTDGREQAPWIVFSNALGTNLSLWDGQVALLQSRFRILRYEQRGHGASDMPPAGTNLDDLAGDLVGLLEHFGIDTAILVGASMGAITVLRCAARVPARCRGIIACDGQWASSPGARQTWQERFAVAKRDGMRALAQATAARWTRPDFRVRQPRTFAHMEEMVARTPREGYIGCAASLQDFDFRRDYPGLSMPVLYLAGAQDGDVPEIMREMAKATPHGVYAEIGHCGHLPNLEQPEAFNRIVAEFIDQHAPASG
jgi:3-oxoadipate enol-lactonase